MVRMEDIIKLIAALICIAALAAWDISAHWDEYLEVIIWRYCNGR